MSPTRVRDALSSKATVFAAVCLAVEDRAGCGVDDDENRAITRRQAEQACQTNGLTGDHKARYLEWVEDAIAHVIDGAPIPSFHDSPVRDIVRFPCGVAV
jgi:hypothetical protein